MRANCAARKGNNGLACVQDQRSRRAIFRLPEPYLPSAAGLLHRLDDVFLDQAVGEDRNVSGVGLTGEAHRHDRAVFDDGDLRSGFNSSAGTGLPSRFAIDVSSSTNKITPASDRAFLKKVANYA